MSFIISPVKLIFNKFFDLLSFKLRLKPVQSGMGEKLNESINICNVSLQEMENQEKIYEDLKQNLHKENMKLSHVNIMVREMESEVQKLQLDLKNKISQFQKHQFDEKQAYLNKINDLQGTFEKEAESTKIIISELEEKIANTKSKIHSRNYKEDVEFTENQNKTLREEINALKKEYLEATSALKLCENEKSTLLEKIKVIKEELEEMKEVLKSKDVVLESTAEALKDLQEEKALLSSELSILKAGPVGAIQRGNSLFAEVDDKSKQLAGKIEIITNKYAQAKKILSMKDAENEKLKAENINCLLRNWSDGNHGTSASEKFNKLRENYQKKIDELIAHVDSLKLRQESPQIVTVSDTNLSQLQWIHAVVNNARAEAGKLRTELNEKSAQSLVDANQLYMVQQDLQKLNAQSMKDKALINELKMKWDSLQKKSFGDEEANNKTLKENNQQHPKGIRFADDVKREDSDTKKCLKRIPKPQSFPRLYFSENNEIQGKVIQTPQTEKPQ